jgi:hypothetical protein
MISPFHVLLPFRKQGQHVKRGAGQVLAANGTDDCDEDIPSSIASCPAWPIDTGKVRTARRGQANARLLYYFLLLVFQSDSADNWNSPFH